MIRSLLQRSSALRHLIRKLRMSLVRAWGGYQHVHPTANFTGKVRISRDVEIGAYASIGLGAWIQPKVKIGKYCALAPFVSIIGADHRFDRPGIPIFFSGRPPLPETVVEDDVWVGQHAVILAGVRIGRGSIVGAGSIVTKDVPPYTIVAGNPAKKIRDRFDSESARTQHDQMLSQAAAPGILPSAKL